MSTSSNSLNPWTLLDTRDLRGHPRSTRERALDDVIEHLQTLATLPEVRCVADGDDIFCDLVGGTDLTEAITVVMRLRVKASQFTPSPL